MPDQFLTLFDWLKNTLNVQEYPISKLPPDLYREFFNEVFFMSHDIFPVEFKDGSRMYGINDGTSCYMHPFLFPTQKVAQAWLSSGDRDTRTLPTESDNAGMMEEDVEVVNKNWPQF